MNAENTPDWLEDPLKTLKAEIDAKRKKLKASSLNKTSDSVERISNTDFYKHQYNVSKEEQSEKDFERPFILQQAQLDTTIFGKNENMSNLKSIRRQRRGSNFSMSPEMFEADGQQSPMDLPYIDADDYKSAETRAKIISFTRCLLAMWYKEELDAKRRQENQNVKRQNKTSSFEQTVKQLQNLIKLIESCELGTEILCKLAEIFSECRKRRYAAAHEAYLRLSIGNAPWPIGVTSVVIHERSAHDRLSNVAHALNDEATRKWIQSLKRLMTFCQSKFPPIDASQRVG